MKNSHTVNSVCQISTHYPNIPYIRLLVICPPWATSTSSSSDVFITVGYFVTSYTIAIAV